MHRKVSTVSALGFLLAISFAISAPSISFAASVSGADTKAEYQYYFSKSVNLASGPALVLVNVEDGKAGELGFNWLAKSVAATGYSGMEFVTVVERVAEANGKKPAIPERSTLSQSVGNLSGDNLVYSPPSDTQFVLPKGKGKKRFDGTFRAQVLLSACSAGATKCDDTNRSTITSSNWIKFAIKNGLVVVAK